MSVTMSLGITGVRPSLNIIVTMASKRIGSKDTFASETGDAVEQVFMGLLVYEGTKLAIDKDIKLKWHDINDTFSGTFVEYLEDHKVYVNIHKSSLYHISCMYLVFPCTDMIHWIVLHTNPETTMLRSASRIELATFRVKDYQVMYHFPQLMITMEKPFNTRNNANSRGILKSWVKEPAKFRTKPSLVYKMKILQKAYQYLVIFACDLYG